MTLREIPEVAGLAGRGSVVRIPPGVDVPVTPRVRRLIDSAPFRRLSQISQLGLVGLVYPAANHTRYEHSLGVYQAALEYVQSLAGDQRFAAVVGREDAETLVVAALVHDVGHWPYCHPIEDLRLPGVPEHETLAREFVLDPELADAIREDWETTPEAVVALLAGEPQGPAGGVLDAMLSGPIDVDKVDYLARDSLHAGVPYGQHFDRSRLVRSLCLNEAGDGLAITEKGKTAAEMMVFARYVMFSEVYWHHAVRAATAMFQRAFYRLRDRVELAALFRMAERPFVAALSEAADGAPATQLLDGLFGPRRRLYKRLAQYSVFEEPELYARLTRRPYEWLTRCSGALADVLAAEIGAPVGPDDVLIDAPPTELEVEFDVDVFYPKSAAYRRLGDLSPMVRALAKEQFDDFVKRVRVFVHPRIVESARACRDFPALATRAIDLLG